MVYVKLSGKGVNKMKFGFLSHLDLNLYLFRLPIMKKLIDDGHEVFAICPKGDKFDLFKEHDIKSIEYKIQRSSLNPLKEVKSIYNIYTAIKPLKLDILHTFTAKPNIYGTIAGKCAKVPVILNLVEGLGSFYIENNFKNKFIRWVIEKLYKFVFKLSDQVVFVNSDDPKYLASKKVIAKNKITIIKSVGIDTDEFNMSYINQDDIGSLKKSLGLENKKIVLMVARAIWHKGVREYYEAAKILSDNKSIKFILVGDIDEGNHSSVNKSFLENGSVMWLGHRDDILLLTAMCDIYALPSYREGVPRTLLEAASMSKAIVTTDTVGCREVVENCVNGLLVPIKDSESLAQGISRILSDDGMRTFMEKNSREKAIKEFAIEHIVEQYIKLYSEVSR